MFRSLGLLCLAIVAGVFAKDPNQAVTRGSAELSAGTSYARYTGNFDAKGDYHSFPDSLGSPALYAVPMRIRVGLGKGYEVRADWTYLNTNTDARDRDGMGQPSIALRYIAQNFGVVTTVTLPFATGDYDNGDVNSVVEVGGLLRAKTTHFRFTSLASYIDDFDEKEILRLWIRPEVLWWPGFSTFMTAEFLKSLGEEAYLGTLGPGARVDFSEAFATEVTTPFSVIGRNSPIAGWAISLRVLWTRKF